MKASSFVFDAIGTTWQIDYPPDRSGISKEQLLQKITTRIESFDKTYSRFRSDSVVTQMSQKKGTYTLPPDSQSLFSVYRTLYTLTDGLFTPLIGQTLSDAGYDAQYSFNERPLTPPPSWEKTFSYTKNSVELFTPALLDFGAGGKGYLVDIVGDLLDTSGIHSYCIYAGGDILQKDAGDTPITIGLENPQNTQQVIGTVAICNESICASAGNRRAWGTYTHMINPQTLTSPTQILATWVVAQSALVADALATCLFFRSSTIFMKDFEFEYLTLDSTMSVEKSSGFRAELFTK